MSISSPIRILYPFSANRRVLRGPARGMRFIVEPGIAFSYAIGTDQAAPRFFLRHVQPGMTVYDVGANKGQMTMIFAAIVGPSGPWSGLSGPNVSLPACKSSSRL